MGLVGKFGIEDGGIMLGSWVVVDGEIAGGDISDSVVLYVHGDFGVLERQAVALRTLHWHLKHIRHSHDSMAHRHPKCFHAHSRFHLSHFFQD